MFSGSKFKKAVETSAFKNMLMERPKRANGKNCGKPCEGKGSNLMQSILASQLSL